MKCSVCGGKLLLQDKMYVCASCQNRFPISTFYENNDVFIAYTETDMQGRRTKESIISQEIYNKLQSKNINTFYQRLSAEDLFGENLMAISEIAMSNAKVIIIVGTSGDSFKNTTARYKDWLDTKILIPVYSDMTTNDLPENLGSLQALNYDKVGAINDLTENVLRLLNRSSEFNIADSNRKSKKNSIALISLFVIALFLSVTIYFVFGTTYILPGKKYDMAQKLFEQNNYVDAIGVFSAIYDYKDSSDKIKNIYNKYVGYYYDEKNDISLHVNIVNNIKAVIEIRNNLENIVITEISEIKNNIISFNYNDNENNQGNVNIVLQNDGLKFNITVETVSSKYSFENKSIFFELSSKTDNPPMKTITADTIKKWLSKPNTKNDIQRDGFDLYIRDSAYSWKSYNIKNTDVIIDCFGKEHAGHFKGSKLGNLDDEIVLFITAPAKIIIPDKVGQSGEIFYDNNNLFIPNINLYIHAPPGPFGYCMSKEDLQRPIEDDTLVLCASKELLGEELFENIEDCYWIFY